MLNGERIIAIVPARGGSKGIPKKNLAPLCGYPLLAWSIFAASRTACIDRVIVSTDSSEFASEALHFGAEVYERDSELATDSVGVFEVVYDLRETLTAEGEDARLYVVLEPASPFRTAALIEDCVAPLAAGLADSTMTFRPCRTNPHRAWRIDAGVATPFLNDAMSWSRRQDLPAAFEVSGEVYAFDCNLLDSETRSFYVGRARPVTIKGFEGTDIDEPIDLELARLLMATSPTRELAPDGGC
jgi:CMP-N,N'-diacetyllegionaminic acid synthase